MGATSENYYAVLLHGLRVGTLCQKGDYTRFVMSDRYLDNPQRSVLGLRFEENLRAPYASALRLPKWFSNLLPEGPLREWIADDRGSRWIGRWSCWPRSATICREPSRS